MRARAWLGSFGAKRWIALGVGLALLVAAVVVIGGQGDDDETVATQSSDTSSTSSLPRITTTSVATTSTTAAVTTTSTASVEPPVEISTTAAPAEQPPVTEPAQPPTTEPAPLGGLDIAVVVDFAKQHRDVNVVAPTTQTGATTCPAYFERPSDAGDDTTRDIDRDWSLARYCDGIYRLTLPTVDDAPLEAVWMEADTQPGGCAGADRVVVGWELSGIGAIIATPTCDASSWQWLDAAGAPVFNGYRLQLDFRESALAAGASFHWRGFVQAVGDDVTDAVPNAGPEHFLV